MQSLDDLLSALNGFEAHAAPDERKAAVPLLRRLSQKLEIRSLELLDQRLLLTRAEAAREMDTIRDLKEHSSFPEIVSWCGEILNLKRQPRTLPFQTIQL